MELLDNFKAIEIETPVDVIARQIRELIVSGQLKEGDKLPSERKLSEKLGVGRTYIRDAIKKLEFLGILATIPQSGVLVKGIDISVMEGLLSNVMKIEKPDFFSLVETRVMMERFVVQQAAKNRTEKELLEIEKALLQYKIKTDEGSNAEQEDLNYHLKIIDASHNTVIKTLMLIILPDILSVYRKENICGEETTKDTLAEHKSILEAIRQQDTVMAEKHMMEHLKDVYEFSKSKVD